jgi:hypothetical protein
MGKVARPGRIRFYGPLVALVVPLVVGTIGLLVYNQSCSGYGCVRPSSTAWGLFLLVAPTAIPAGLPWFAGPITYAATIVSSLVMWLLFGRWAARRATSDVDASWPAYFRELAFIVLGLWAGLGLGMAGIFLFLTT